MGSDHEAEIRASVGAHQDLGPGYDDALAEGLVERIGAEIDRRIEAQLRRYGAPSGPTPGPAYGAAEASVAGGPAAGGYLPGGHPGYFGYPGYPGYQAPLPPHMLPGPPVPPGYQVPVPGARPTARSAGQRSVAMTVIALGSMTLGVAATALVAHSQHGGQAVMVLLIWAAIAIVNIAYAKRC
jgi:hypothetical protein